MRKITIFIVLAIILAQPSILAAGPDTDDPADFFSFKKYQFTYINFYEFRMIDQTGAGLQMRMINKIARYFVKGFNALVEKDPARAIAQFKRSSRLVPEYFHSDFIIALAYEEEKDYPNAARYYKSYLEKLKKFHDGFYRITEPLIRKTVSFDIIDYDDADRLIRDRMAAHGIDMDKVHAAREPSWLIFVVVAVMAGAILYLIAKAPPVKKFIYKTRAKSYSGPGAWICPDCGRENSAINTICYGCKRPHN